MNVFYHVFLLSVSYQTMKTQNLWCVVNEQNHFSKPIIICNLELQCPGSSVTIGTIYTSILIHLTE